VSYIPLTSRDRILPGLTINERACLIRGFERHYNPTGSTPGLSPASLPRLYGETLEEMYAFAQSSYRIPRKSKYYSRTLPICVIYDLYPVLHPSLHFYGSTGRGAMFQFNHRLGAYYHLNHPPVEVETVKSDSDPGLYPLRTRPSTIKSSPSRAQDLIDQYLGYGKYKSKPAALAPCHVSSV